jgi:Fur family transcriptional regulator, ferric uptake regulator
MMTPEIEKHFAQYLRSAGMNGSKARSTVLRVFMTQGKPMSVQELMYPVKQSDLTISFSTVYHTMKLLVACGLASGVASARDATRYEHAFTAKCSHSQLVCKACGAIVPDQVHEAETMKPEGHDCAS